MPIRKSLQFEQLEQRQMLSVSANAHAAHLALANEYTGVLKHYDLNVEGAASSVLLPTGRHLLVAAHVSSGPHGRVVETGLPAPNDLIPTVGGATIHPERDPVLLNDPDLAILELPFELDPLLFERYDIYRASDQLNQVAIRVGFGASGEDMTESGTFGVKRIGVNRYGAASQKTLSYDFDDDDPINNNPDRLGDGNGIHIGTIVDGEVVTDPKYTEVISAGGDSGSPAFIDGKIAGIASLGINGSAYQKIAVDMRISYAAPWIDSIIDEPGVPTVADVTISGVDTNSTHLAYSFAEQMNDPATNWSAGDQLKTVPVGGADTVAITFSEHVINIDQNSLLLKRLTSGQVQQLATDGFSYDVTTHTATWTFDGPFEADQYYLSLSDTVTDVHVNLEDLNEPRNPLDGEWVNPFSVTTTNNEVSSFAGVNTSGDGSAGGDFNFVFTILPGDASLDNIANGVDYNIIYLNNLGGPGHTYQQADFNGDGITDTADYDFWLLNLGTNLRDLVFADFDGSGVVDVDDYFIWLDNLGINEDGEFAEGDADHDGDVDMDDYMLLEDQFELELDWVA